MNITEHSNEVIGLDWSDTNKNILLTTSKHNIKVYKINNSNELQYSLKSKKEFTNSKFSVFFFF
jgi:hypothetical protein